MGCDAPEVIGDGDGEGISAVEIGGWCVGPGSGFGVDGCGTVAGAVAGFDGEISAVGQALRIRCIQISGDGRGVFCANAAGVTGDGAGDTGSVNQAEVALGPGGIGEGNLIKIGAAAGGRRGDIGDGDR